MRIVITGANGFIGSALFKRFKKKHKVLGIDKEGKSSKNFMIWDLTKDVPFYDGEYEKLNKIHGKIDLIIHCANNVGVQHILGNPKFFKQNIRLDEWALNLQYKEPKIIYLSSSEVYGSNCECKEQDPFIIPQTVRGKYTLAKVLGETLLQEQERDYVIIRPFNVTGPGQNINKGVIPKFINDMLDNKIINVNPNASRCFIHIDDFVNAVERIVNNFEQYNRNILNIGSNDNYITISKLAELIKKTLKSNSEFRYLNCAETYLRNVAERRFKITKDLKDIISDTIKYVKKLRKSRTKNDEI